jgi:2-deoxy-D-gluconate 3-dehydrogenase
MTVMDRFSLKGKSGIVTGAATGIGKGIANALVQAGAALLIVGRRKEILENTARVLGQHGGPVVPFAADVSKMEDIPRIVSKGAKELGKIDFLFNNAGTIHRTPSEKYGEADWDSVIQTNLKGPFFLAQAVAQTIIAAQRPGTIVNTSSLIAFQGGKTVPAYAASKGGLNQVTKTMANDWAQYGIRVNAIAPGWFETELTDPLKKNPDRNKEILSRIPLGRWGNPDELGGVAVFLASDASSYMTGQTVVVDGGWLSY